MKALVLLGALFSSSVVLAQPQDFPVARGEGQPVAEEPEPPMPRYVHNERYLGVHLGINVGLLAVDVQVGKFYAYAAAGAGITLLTNNRFGAFAGGLGYSIKLRETMRSQWRMDLLAMLAPGWITGAWPNDFEAPPSRVAYVGVGVGVGFRYEMENGFSLGFKIPVFGYAITPSTANNSAAGVGLYYTASAAALPIISVGYRF